MNNMLFLLFTLLFGLLLVTKSDEGCPGVEIVSRKQWGAREPIRTQPLKHPLNRVIILHTVTQFCKTKFQCIRSMRFIQDLHMDERGFSDIGYNFVIGGDGRVYEGRGWSKVGASAINYNTVSVGIAFIGNYNKYPPTQAQINATLNFIACGVERGYLTPTRLIHGHRDVSCTESPGDKLYAVIRTWKNFKGGRLDQYYCNPMNKPVILDEELDY